MTTQKAARDILVVARMLVGEQGDHIIAEVMGGKVEVVSKARGQTLNSNFLVVCDHGDWSGFMPLKQALQRLDQLAERSPGKYYAVVER